MAEYSPELDRRYGAEVVHLLRHWEDREERRKQGRLEVVDFDLAGDVDSLIPPEDLTELSSITNRPLMLFRLSQIAEHFDPESMDGQFMRARIRAHLALVFASERRRFYPLDEYLEETLGLIIGSEVAFISIPEEEITQQKQKVTDLFSRLGFDFNRTGWERFFNGAGLDPIQVESMYREAEDKLVPIMQQTAGVNYKPDYKLEFVNKEVEWINWSSGNEESGLQLLINKHLSLSNRWFLGVPERLVSHEELVHMFEAFSWRENIRNRLINPGYGLTTVPGPEQWHCEGFGNTLPFFIPEIYEALTPVGRFSVELRLLETWIYRNAHISVNNDSEKLSEITGYILDLLPNTHATAVKRLLEQRLSNSLSRAYQGAYGGSYEHRQYAERLGSPNKEFDKRLELVKFFLTQPATPIQIARKVADLESVKLIEEQVRENWFQSAKNLIGRVVKGELPGVYFRHGFRESAKRKT